MVFLNTCNSGRSRRRSDEETASFVSATQDLFGLGAPHVVSIQFPFGDKAAVALARSIYENLAEGKMVEQSVGEAWIAANYAKDGQSMNWAIPVAYAQDPGDRMKEGLLGAMVLTGALLLAQRKVSA